MAGWIYTGENLINFRGFMTDFNMLFLASRTGEFPLKCGWIRFTADSPVLMINSLSYSHCIIGGALYGWKFNKKVYLELYNRATNPQTRSSHNPFRPISAHPHASTQFPGHHHIVEQHMNGRMLCEKGGATRMFVEEGWHIINESWD